MILTNSKILIVGGAGFVGSNLAHHLLDLHAPQSVWIIDNLLSSDISNVPNDSRVNFVFGSIANDKILNALPTNLDVVFHLACYHGNQSSIADPLADHANNTVTSLKLFDLLKGFKNLKKVVYAAAGCAVAEKTFGDAKPTSEDAPVSLFHDSPYSISKLIGEMYGNYYFRQYGFPFVKARFQNVYGPREILGAGRWRGTPHTIWRNVIPTFIWKSLHGEALPLDNAGNASRDFIFVEDIVRGLIACIEYGEPGQAYNLATGVETNMLELANRINVITGNKSSVYLRPARDWDRSGKRFGATEKSRDKLGFVTETDIQKGLERTVEWTRVNQKLIERTIANHDLIMAQLNRDSRQSEKT
ncbi:MAG: NAD-dependent epimerase/dehydratase family protein [Bacteroidales bacterium]|jgi:nucleoside-diphosphate-sugar epimerase